jgi:hypothetical protein
MLKILAGAALVGTLAALPAQAHDANVYDANGHLVGPLVGIKDLGIADPVLDKVTGLVVIKLNGINHFLSVSAQGIVNTGPKFYFISSDCSGAPALLPFDIGIEILPYAVFDGQTVWSLATKQWQGYAVHSYLQRQACFQLPPDTNFVGAPAVPARVNFTAPFTVK